MIFAHKRAITVSRAFEERAGAEKSAFQGCRCFFMCVACLVLIERISL